MRQTIKTGDNFVNLCVMNSYTLDSFWLILKLNFKAVWWFKMKLTPKIELILFAVFTIFLSQAYSRLMAVFYH